jgi:hypothetical protein
MIRTNEYWPGGSDRAFWNAVIPRLALAQMGEAPLCDAASPCRGPTAPRAVASRYLGCISFFISSMFCMAR